MALPMMASKPGAKLFRDISMLQIKRAIGVLHECKAREREPEVLVIFERITVEIEAVVNEIHTHFFDQPLPAYRTVSELPSSAPDGVNRSEKKRRRDSMTEQQTVFDYFKKAKIDDSF